MSIKYLEEKAIYFEIQVSKVAKDSKLEQIVQAQEEAYEAYTKVRRLYQEYLDLN